MPFMELFFSEQEAGKCCINHMFQFSQTTFYSDAIMARAGNKSRSDSKGIDSFSLNLPIDPEPPFSRQRSPLRELDDSGRLDGRQPWATLSVGPRVVGEGERWRAASLWHFCTVSRWGKRTLICSMSCVLSAKGTSSLAGTQRLAVSPGPLNKPCVISLRATREGNRSLCATSSNVFCWAESSLRPVIFSQTHVPLLRAQNCVIWQTVNRCLWGVTSGYEKKMPCSWG